MVKVPLRNNGRGAVQIQPTMLSSSKNLSVLRKTEVHSKRNLTLNSLNFVLAHAESKKKLVLT